LTAIKEVFGSEVKHFPCKSTHPVGATVEIRCRCSVLVASRGAVGAGLQSLAVPRATLAGPVLRPPAPIRVLLVEDDPADALLVEELLRGEPGTDVDLVLSSVDAIKSAKTYCATEEVDCVLVDLGLPDATGMDALAAMLDICPDTAVVVLTGQRDRDLALAAVLAGAQDYLIKDEVNGPLLDRTIRLAVQRRKAERDAVTLAAARVRARHNSQVMLGLRPHLRVQDPSLELVSRYKPGNAGEVLGGDFLDAVELADGSVQAVIGDVSGHGPDEAAVGVNLRIAWRALTVACSPPATVFRVLADQIANDIGMEELFATLASVELDPDRRRLSVRVAGHPAPILITAGGAAELDVRRGSIVGFDLDAVPPETVVELPAAWRVLLYTDGLIEGRDGSDGERWGTTGLLEFLAARRDLSSDELVDAAIDEASRRHGGPLPDDVAVLVIGRG
jgi:serine phosphatase RsbU (regulator of sigma subunit)